MNNNIVYKILFLPLISIENVLIGNKNIIKKLLSLIIPLILLPIWGIVWVLVMMFVLALLGIGFFLTGKYISTVTIIWSLFFIVIPIINKQKKLNIVYIFVLICVLLLANQMFVLRLSTIYGSNLEPDIKNGQKILINLINSSNSYKQNDLIVYTDKDIDRIGKITLTKDNSVIVKEVVIPYKNIVGKVIYIFK